MAHRDPPAGAAAHNRFGVFSQVRAPGLTGKFSFTNRASLYCLSVPPRMATPREAAAVLAASIVIRCTYMTSPVSRLIRLEMRKRMRSASRQRSSIPVVRVIAIIHMAVKAARSVEPGPGSDKNAANEPIGPVIAVGRAVIRCVVEVSIWTNGRRSKVYTDANLSWGVGAHCADEACEA
jgi:hypothetical protein